MVISASVIRPPPRISGAASVGRSLAGTARRGRDGAPQKPRSTNAREAVSIDLKIFVRARQGGGDFLFKLGSCGALGGGSRRPRWSAL